MGQVRHGSATTTHAVRAAIQRSQASFSTLSRELGINPKTVAKWRKRATVEDLKTGPNAPRSTNLTEAEEAAVVAFRRHTLLPLDDCLYALQPSIPHLTRSALHRCLQRHGISRLPDIEGDKPKRQRFKRTPPVAAALPVRRRTGLKRAQRVRLRVGVVGQITVFGGPERRRRWSDEERVQILAEAFAPGAFVAQVARRHDVSTGFIYTWRRKLRGRSDASTSVAGFAEAVVVDDCPVELPTVQPTIVVDLARGGRVSIFALASPDQVAAVLKSVIR